MTTDISRSQSGLGRGLAALIPQRSESSPATDLAISAIERAIAIDSASEPIERQNCRLCGDFEFLADMYLWWDSLPAAERTAQRSLRARPKAKNAWHILTRAAGARGDTAAMHRYLSKFDEANHASLGALYVARQHILAEEYDQAEAELRPMLDSPAVRSSTKPIWARSASSPNPAPRI